MIVNKSGQKLFLFLLFLVGMAILPEVSRSQSQRQPLELPLKNTHIETTIGELDGSGGCHLQFSARLKANQGPRALEGRQVGSTRMADGQCEIDMEIGEPDPAEIKQHQALQTPKEGYEQQSTRSEAAPGPSRMADSSGSLVQPLVAIGTSGFGRTWVIDPVFITVNSVRGDVAWSFDAAQGTVICTPPCIGIENLEWFTLTGWGKDYDTFNTFLNAPTNFQNHITAGFSNFVFCPFGPTFVDYSPVDVRGWWNGDLTLDFDVVISGSCIALLNVRWELAFTS